MTAPLPIIAKVKRVVAQAISRHNIAAARPASTKDCSPLSATLPGQRIELGATGWQIIMAEKTLHHPFGIGKPSTFLGYQAISPEGHPIAWTQHNLQDLKSEVEGWARDRQELQL